MGMLVVSVGDIRLEIERRATARPSVLAIWEENKVRKEARIYLGTWDPVGDVTPPQRVIDLANTEHGKLLTIWDAINS